MKQKIIDQRSTTDLSAFRAVKATLKLDDKFFANIDMLESNPKDVEPFFFRDILNKWCEDNDIIDYQIYHNKMFHRLLVFENKEDFLLFILKAPFIYTLKA